MEKLPFEVLKSEGFYLTTLLRRVITLLHKAKTPLSVPDILEQMRRSTLKPNKTTLYRLLTKLAESALVQESLFTDEVRRYCLTLSKSHHHHFVCQECGYSEELPGDICNQVAIESKKLKDRGFEIISHNMDIEGLCKHCAAV